MDYQLINPELSEINGFQPIERIFANRGIKAKDINHYLNTTADDILDPLLLDNIEDGAKMLIQHLASNHKIFIQVDSDVDGFTSAAILINYIYKIAPGTAQNNIIYRLHEGKQHGIIADTVPDGIQLVIVPDAGSNDVLEHRKLCGRNIDILVLDHHEIEQQSKYACVINNQAGEYPNRTLSGAGVVYKFCQYIDSVIGQNYSYEILDLAIVGLVGDMMDIRQFETRELITLGLSNIHNDFLSLFMEKQEYKLQGQLTPFGISFYIAPYINAMIRVGTQEEKMVLFESMIDFKANEQIPSTKRGCKGQLESRIEQACRICSNAKNRQNKICDENSELIDQFIIDNNSMEHPVLIIRIGEDFDPNLTGLMANQVAGRYQRPVLLVRPEIKTNDNGEIISFDWVGSGRAPANIKLENFREFISNSGYVNYASGHASAFGVSIPDFYMATLEQYIDARLNVSDFSTSYKVDFIWDSKQIEQKKDLILRIGELKGIWGQGLQEPYIAVENIVITPTNIVLMSPDKNPTIKIILPGGICLLKFKVTKEEYDALFTKTGAIKINIIGTCNLNEWNGNITPQIIIQDYEIISKLDYLF